MNRLLKPSIKFMNKLNYMQKFSLIFIIFLIPILTMMSINIVQVQKQYNFSRKQRMALEYNIKLRALIQHVQQHRGLSAVYIGVGKDLKGSILEKETEIDKDLREINLINEEYGKTLEVSDKWLEIQSQWFFLKASLETFNSRQSFEEHTNLIARILELTVLASDNSKLFIQSRLETYYLVDSIVNKLPLVTEYMGQARAVGAAVASRKSMTLEEKNMLNFLHDAIGKRIADNSRAMEVSFNNPQIKKQLEDKSNAALSASNQMITMLSGEILDASSITIDPNAYFTSTTETINKIYDFLNEESNIVSNISEEDFNSLFIKRNLLLLFTVLTLILIVYLFSGFYFSVKASITTIEEASGKIAAGILTERVQLETKDETQKISSALNRMLDKLIDNYNEVNEARGALEKIAHYDFLTGLPNRAFLMKNIKELIENIKATGKPAALLFLDLDRFKAINDTLGHQMGDVVLKTVAAHLSGVVGGTGTLCRLGGDEFIILLKEVFEEKELNCFCKRIKEAVERPLVLKDSSYSVGVSIGYTIFSEYTEDIEELIRQADLSMYMDKQNKKGAF